MFPTLLVILTRLPMTPASASDANQPSNTPMPVSLKPLRSTRITTSRREAPNATRTPISCARCETSYRMRPQIPIAASSTAAPAKSDSSVSLSEAGQ